MKVYHITLPFLLEQLIVIPHLSFMLISSKHLESCGCAWEKYRNESISALHQYTYACSAHHSATYTVNQKLCMHVTYRLGLASIMDLHARISVLTTTWYKTSTQICNVLQWMFGSWGSSELAAGWSTIELWLELQQING